MTTLSLCATGLRAEVAEWYRQQPHPTVADALTVGYTTLAHRPSHEAPPELQRLRDEHALHVQRVRADFEHRLELKRDELAALREHADALRAGQEGREQAVVERERQAARELYDRELARKQQEVDRLTEALAVEKARLEPILEKHGDLISHFSTSARLGTFGERLTQAVFDELDLGELEDTRHDTTTGCEDFLWTNADGLRCSVEVKFVESIHSVKDTQKHLTRVQEAARAGKINAGLFLSLRCRIPATRMIHLKHVAGVPVLYVSGGDMTPRQVVEVGFRVLTQLWPHLRSAQDAADSDPHSFDRLLRSVSDLVSTHLDTLASLTKQIDDVEGHANAILKTAHRLRRLRQDSLDAIANIQNAHDIWPTRPAADDAQLETAVRAYYDKHNRYPKEHQLATPLPAGTTLHHLVARVKAQVALDRKRRRAE